VLHLPLAPPAKSSAPADGGAPAHLDHDDEPAAATTAEQLGLSFLALAAMAAWRRYAGLRPKKMKRALSADVLELLGGAAPIELLD